MKVARRRSRSAIQDCTRLVAAGVPLARLFRLLHPQWAGTYFITRQRRGRTRKRERGGHEQEIAASALPS
jgi:hypothetical protein